MDNEIWKDVKGYEGIYKVSNLGRLQHYTTRNGWNILKNTNKKGGYLSVVLNLNCKIRSFKLHRLVAIAFIENPNNLPQVNHKNCIKTDNRVCNLEWCTAKENAKHAIKNNDNILKGMNNYNKFIRPKKVYQFDMKGNFIAVYQNCSLAGRITGLCSRDICGTAKHEQNRKQCGGFVWKYEEDLTEDQKKYKYEEVISYDYKHLCK